MDENKKRISVQLRNDQIEALDKMQHGLDLDSRSATIRWVIDQKSVKAMNETIKKEIENSKEFHLELFEETENGNIRVPSTLTKKDEGEKVFESKENLDKWFHRKVKDFWEQDFDHLKYRSEREMAADLEEGQCPACQISKPQWNKISYLAMHIDKKSGRHDEFCEENDLENKKEIENWLKEHKKKNNIPARRLGTNAEIISYTDKIDKLSLISESELSEKLKEN
jgi:hypothetical protein